MRNKTWIYPGVVLLVLVPLAAQQGNVLQPRSPLTVCDSKGKIIGGVVDANFAHPLTINYPSLWPTVAFKWGQETIPVGVSRDFFTGTSGWMYFASSDCTGTPYLSPPLGRSLFSQSFVDKDGTLYAARAGAPIVRFNPGSRIYASIYPPGATDCAPGDFSEIAGVEGQPVTNLTAMYPPPYVLK